jgi:hypothetical protein
MKDYHNTNAKEELLKILEGEAKIKCATIQLGDEYLDDADKRKIQLKLNYSEEGYNQFLIDIDLNYDSGFGGQELFGTVWLEDNTWLSRGEYDGSEWWVHNKLPEIPKYLYE